MAEFYPDIYQYLETLQNSKSVSIKGLDDIVAKVRAQTGLSQETCAEIVRLFFQEMRNSMLRGDIVTIRGLGKLYINAPVNGSKKKVFPKFAPYGKLLKMANEKK